MIGSALALFFMLAVIVGTVVLQIFLSQRDNKWAGLVLPAITFLISLVTIAGTTLYSSIPSTQTIVENGVTIEQAGSSSVDVFLSIPEIAYLFVLYNIPTIILLVIYAACRGNHKRKRALEKMSVQDLG